MAPGSAVSRLDDAIETVCVSHASIGVTGEPTTNGICQVSAGQVFWEQLVKLNYCHLATLVVFRRKLETTGGNKQYGS